MKREVRRAEGERKGRRKEKGPGKRGRRHRQIAQGTVAAEGKEDSDEEESHLNKAGEGAAGLLHPAVSPKALACRNRGQLFPVDSAQVGREQDNFTHCSWGTLLAFCFLK